MRYVLICVLSVVAYALGHFTGPATYRVTTVTVEGVAWCLYGQYDSLKAYDQTSRVAPHSMVDIHSRGVTVYVPCER
jgi:hypothetical protein